LSNKTIKLLSQANLTF